MAVSREHNNVLGKNVNLLCTWQPGVLATEHSRHSGCNYMDQFLLINPTNDSHQRDYMSTKLNDQIRCSVLVLVYCWGVCSEAAGYTIY